MIWYKETADSDIDWIIEEICSNLTKGQYIEKCIRSRLAEKVFNGDGIYVKPGIRKDGIGTEMTRRRGTRC